MAFVVQGLGSVTGGGVHVSSGQEPVPEAGVAVVLGDATPAVAPDRSDLTVARSLPTLQRRLCTTFGCLVPGSCERVALLRQLGQQSGVARSSPCLLLAIGQVRLPGPEVRVVPAHGRGSPDVRLRRLEVLRS